MLKTIKTDATEKQQSPGSEKNCTSRLRKETDMVTALLVIAAICEIAAGIIHLWHVFH